MRRYRLVESVCLQLTVNEDPEDYDFDTSASHDNVVFDRRFLFGYQGAVRKLKRHFRRQLSYGPWRSEYRLYEVDQNGSVALQVVPAVESTSIGSGKFGLTLKQARWSDTQTTTSLIG